MSDKVLEAVVKAQGSAMEAASVLLEEARNEILRLRTRIAELEAKATDTTEAA